MQFVFLLLLIIPLTWSHHAADASVGLDGSYFTMLNYWAAHDFQKLQFIQYTFGPLGFLKNAIAFGDNVIWANLTIVFLKISTAFLFRDFFKKRFSDIGIIAILYVLFVFFSFDFYFYIIVFLAVIQYRTSGKWVYPIIICFFGVFASLIKVNLAVNSLFIFLPIWLTFIIKREWKNTLIVPLISLLFFILIWLIMFASIDGAWEMIRAYLAFISNNGSTVLHAPNSHFWLGLTFAGLLFMFFNSFRDKNSFVFLILCVFLFSEFKYAFNRQDAGHLLEFLKVLIFVSGFYLLTAKKIRVSIIAAILIMISAFTFNLEVNGIKKANVLKFQWNGILNFQEEVIDYQKYKLKYQEISKKNLNSVQLPKVILDIINNRKLDFYPWELCYAAKYNLNYQPRPGLQNFGFAPYLVNKNTLNIVNGDGPDFFLWRTKKWKGQLGSIDSQYLLNSDGPFLMSILSNYSRLKNGNSEVLFSKTNQERIKEISRTIGHYQWFEDIQVPKSIHGNLIRAKIDLKSTIARNLKNFIYKTHHVKVIYTLENGQNILHDISKNNLKMGIWISPYIFEFNPKEISFPVKSIRFEYSLEDPAFMDGISIEWINYSVRNSKIFGEIPY